jgi:alpha-glucosidase
MPIAILLSLALAAVLSLCPALSPALGPSAVAASPQSQSAASVSSPHLQANGVEMESNGVHLKITALRDDVLRVRYWRGGSEPEDASWAVLPEARGSSVKISALADHPGFSTAALRVEVDPRNLGVTVRDKDGNLLQQDSSPIEFHNAGFELSQSMSPNAHYFGLGDKAGSFDRRDGSFTLWNTDAYAFQESTDPLYKAIPFFMTYDSGRAIGTLLDNTWRTHFDFGRTRANTLVMGAAGGPIDYYFLYGPSAKQVLSTYAWLTGPTPLPPLWSFGFQQSRYGYMTRARVEEVAKRLRDDHIPADAIYLDIDYQDRNRPFTVDPERFADMPGLVRKLHDEDLHVVAITDLHIAQAPNQNYATYDSGIAQDRFVHNPDGSVYSGKVWPGDSVFPDFTQQATRAWWGTLYRDFVQVGIDGFWNDMNEPAIFVTKTKTMPEDVQHRIDEPGFRSRTATHAEIHNVYGMENARATAEGLLTLRPNERPFVLTRAAYAGSQRYAATWTGDNSSSWNHLRLTTFMLKNLGLSGFSFAGADVGGFAGNPSSELLTKWIEIAAFQPIDRDHTEKGTADQEVWVHGPEQEAIRRRFIEERYRLLPYLYTTAEDNMRSGLPIVRPLFLEFPDALPDKHPMDIDPLTANEFLFGPDLLIAPPPIIEQTVAYAVQLPSAGWYDYWTGKRVEGKTVISAAAGVQPESGVVSQVTAVTVTPQLAELPVYVRPGTILPYAPLTQSTRQQPSGALTLRVYPGPDCHGSFYLDDGHSFDYRQGAFLRMQFSCETRADGGVAVRLGAHEGSYPAWWSQLHIEVHGMGADHKSVHLNGQPVPATLHDETLDFSVADDGHGKDLTID